MNKMVLVLSLLALSGGAALGQTTEGLVTQPLNASTRAELESARLAELHFDSTSITLRDSVAIMQARFICVTERRDGKPTANQGTANEIVVRQSGTLSSLLQLSLGPLAINNYSPPVDSLTRNGLVSVEIVVETLTHLEGLEGNGARIVCRAWLKHPGREWTNTDPL